MSTTSKEGVINTTSADEVRMCATGNDQENVSQKRFSEPSNILAYQSWKAKRRMFYGSDVGNFSKKTVNLNFYKDLFKH